MEPHPGEFDFSYFHQVVNKLAAAGIAVVLGALLFIYSIVVVRREVVEPGPVQAHKDAHIEPAE